MLTILNDSLSALHKTPLWPEIRKCHVRFKDSESVFDYVMDEQEHGLELLQHQGFVGLLDGVVVGLGISAPCFLGIFVRRAHRRQGYGTQLYKATSLHAYRAWGLQGLVADKHDRISTAFFKAVGTPAQEYRSIYVNHSIAIERRTHVRDLQAATGY